MYLQIKGENTSDIYSDLNTSSKVTIYINPGVNLYKLKLFCVDYHALRMFSWSEYTTSAQVLTLLWKMKKKLYIS